MKFDFTVILKGMGMGIAEVIPGVSGGTIAFITGIYEKLLKSIKAFGPEALKALKTDGLLGLWEAINGKFLLKLIIGMVVGVVFGVFAITWILENYPVLLWAFFFGLIVSSVVFIGKHVPKWGWQELLALVFGSLFAFYITVASPAQGSESYLYIFISGLLAISALMLPGISGSFILLLLGMYTFIIPMVKEALKTLSPESLTVVGIFASGCLVGLIVFSRILTWTFKHYKGLTMALLTGFVFGSLNKIWPWRNVLTYRENSKGIQVPFLEESVLPHNFNGEPFVIWAVILMILGYLSIVLLERMGPKSI